MRVELTLVPDNDRVHLKLSVRDSGIGMDEQQRQHLFQPYTQFEASDTELQIGTGLGLAICQQLTELMGGRLTCESELGRGSCFTLTLEVAVAPDDEAVPSFDPQSLPPLPVRNVLIVEDHEFNRVVLQRQLESLGLRVTCAANGLEGLRLWGREAFDYVLTDCNMPQLNGDQMTRQLRALEASEGRAPTHVLGLTANAQPQEIQRCLEAGMNDCLFKPVTRSVLEQYLREAESARIGSACCFDMAKVNDITAGDVAMTRQLLATVLRTNQEDFDVLQSLYSAGDFSAVGRRCHKILGSARIIHATALISACEQLEQRCQRSAEASELSQLLDVFVKQMNLLQQQIRTSIQR